jgi:hypothetical protein
VLFGSRSFGSACHWQPVESTPHSFDHLVGDGVPPGGMVNPSAFAARKLMTSSNLVGSSTGKCRPLLGREQFCTDY